MSQKNIKLSLTLDAKTGKLVGKIKGASDVVERFGDDGKKAGKKVNTGMVKASKGVKSMSNQLDNAKSSMLALIGVASASQLAGNVISTSDAYKGMQSQIRLVTDSQEELLSVQSQLHVLSLDTRSDVLVNTKLYSALAPTFEVMGKSQKDATRLISLYNKALATTNPTIQEATSSTQQFTQAMGAGILRGEEFNSVYSGGRGVLIALAEGINVPIGALRSMAEQGLLTTDIVVAGLNRQEQSINENFKNIELTVSAAWQNMRTEAGFFIGEAESVSAITGTIADGVQHLALNLDAASTAFAVSATGLGIYHAGALLAKGSTLGLSSALGTLVKNPWVLAITTLAAAYVYLSESTEVQTAKLKDQRAEEEKQLEVLRKRIELQSINIQSAKGSALLAQKKQLQQSVDEYSALVNIIQKRKEDETLLATKIKNQSLLTKALETQQEAENKAFFDSVERENQLFFIKSEKIKQYREMLNEQWNSDDDQAVKADALTEQTLKAETLKDSINDLNLSTKEYGDTWARTGNQIIDAMQSVSSVMDEVNAKESNYAKDTLKINDLKAQAIDTFGEQSKEYLKLTKEQQALDDQRAKNSVEGSMAMLDASVGMYEKGSKAQQVAHNASLVIHAVKLGMNIAEAISAATVAVAEQGKGDPYTAWGRIAAMSVMMGGLLSQIGAGFSGAGGGSPDLSVAAQQTQGTGTVLGDASAKSSSIAHTFDLLNDINVNQYAELQQINLGIKLMNGSLKGVGSSFLTSGLGAFNGESFNLDLRDIASNNLFAQLPGTLGDWGSSIFGGGRSSSVTNGGVDFGAQSLGSLMNPNSSGLQGDAFTTVKTVKDGGWFYSDSTSYDTYYKGLDNQSEQLMGDVFAGLGQSMLGVADNLGLEYERLIKGYEIDLPAISLHNLTGDQINETLQNMVSAEADQMAADLFGSVAKTYQQAGEGLFETVNRLIIEKAVVNDQLSAASITLGDDALATTQALVNLAGGLSDFESSANDYYDAFFSEQEQYYRNQQNITKQLALQNLELPKTRDGYRDLVEALDINTQKGQEQYTVLMSLADAADDFYSVLDDLTNSLVDHYNKIVGTVSAGDPMQLISAQQTISNAIEQANAGYLPTLDSLSDALDVLSSNNDSSYSTLNDFKRDQMLSASLIDQLTVATTDKTVEEHMLDALNSQNETLISIADNTFVSANVDSLNNDSKVYDNGTFDIIAWNAANPDRTRAFRGSHADGLSYVPFDNYAANLHQGEAVIDARTMQGMRKYGLQTGGDNSLKEEIIKLRQELNQLRSDSNEGLLAIAKNTMYSAQTLERLDDDGIATRV